MFLELHALQSFGPTNLNRDATGNPKDSLFGAVRRARISSQSGKRAIRISSLFQKAIGVEAGVRTKLVAGEVAQRLIAAGTQVDSAHSQAMALISFVVAGTDKKNTAKTNVLVYISRDELDLLAQYILENPTLPALLDEYTHLQEASDKKDKQKEARKKEIGGSLTQIKNSFEKALKNRALAPDIALFGRMLADNPTINVDAACQFAHALSTHEVNAAEFDYFTAVDDRQSDDTSGAAMLGLVAYNSATYYRCARIDWEQLVNNLHGDIDLALRTIDGFMRAFALVVPSGKKNSFVNQHHPDFLMAVLRPDNDGQSLINAFEQPIRAKGSSGYVAPSIEALARYWDQTESVFRLSNPLIAVLNPRQHPLPSQELTAATQGNLPEWIGAILAGLEG